MGPFPQTSNGNQYLLVMTEHATRWVDTVVPPDQRAKTVTTAVIPHIIADHGVTKMILTDDQGPCFESEEFKSCLEQLDIKRTRMTPYHPQTNGLTERNNRTLKEWLASKGGNWEKKLLLVLLVHRASVQGTTKKSASQLMYGRKPRLPIHSKTWPQQQPWNMTRLREERKQAIRNVERKQKADAEKSEQREGSKWKLFEVGDQVNCKERGYTSGGEYGRRKLLPKWEGPYIITERLGSIYTIKQGNKEKRVNARLLRKWKQWEKDETASENQEKTAPRRSLST
ncbi:unnamed protein product [Heterobilharzia americana]|nr:unnamed protein product [Heterobilharzia americana]